MLTHSDAVEAMARAMCLQAMDCEHHPCDGAPEGGCLPHLCAKRSRHKDKARAALAALARVAGVEHLHWVRGDLEDEARHMRDDDNNKEPKARVAALLRVLAEAGDE